MPDLILSTIASYLVPLIWVYGAYVIVHGHLSPGGGFAGGTIIAGGLILAALAWGPRRIGRAVSEGRLAAADLAGILAYVLVGLVGMIRGKPFLTNLAAGYPPGTPGHLLSSGTVWLLGAAVGAKVSTTLYGIYARFASEKGDAPTASGPDAGRQGSGPPAGGDAARAGRQEGGG